MRSSSLLTHSILLFMVPASIAYPQSPTPEIHIAYPMPMNLEEHPTLNGSRFSYDNVLDLLEKIESGDIERMYPAEEIDKVNQFVAFLAKQGLLPGDIDQEIALNRSVENLLYLNENASPFFCSLDDSYSIMSSVFYGYANPILCRSWCKKQWDKTREFVKKHKKEIIIGAIVVVAVTVVVVAAVAVSTSAAAAAGGIAASSGSSDAGSSPPHLEPKPQEASQEESLISSLQQQITAFKENVAEEQLAAISELSGISIEENGRIIGSLFTHKTIDALSTQIAENPLLGYDLQNLGLNSTFPQPKWASGSDLSPHASIDLAFSTNYSPLCIDNSADLNVLTYQA